MRALLYQVLIVSTLPINRYSAPLPKIKKVQIISNSFKKLVAICYSKRYAKPLINLLKLNDKLLTVDKVERLLLAAKNRGESCFEK